MSNSDMTQNGGFHYGDFLKQILLMAIGCFVYAIGISVFYSPSKLLAGGVTGIAQILHYQFGLSVPLMMIIVNIPLFILALLFVDRKFTLISLIGLLLTTLFLQLTSAWSLPFSSPLTSVVVGGVLCGMGLGIIFRDNASAGGTDIIAKIYQKHFSGNMAYVGMAINVVIVGISAYIFGIDQAVMTICAMYISSRVNSFILDGIDHRRVVSIITNKPDELSHEIMDKVHRGVTCFKGYGAYTNSENTMLRCVITRRELAKIKRVTKQCDPSAFLTITPLTGVYGKGVGFHSIEKDIN